MLRQKYQLRNGKTLDDLDDSTEKIAKKHPPMEKSRNQRMRNLREIKDQILEEKPRVVKVKQDVKATPQQQQQQKRKPEDFSNQKLSETQEDVSPKFTPSLDKNGNSSEWVMKNMGRVSEFEESSDDSDCSIFVPPTRAGKQKRTVRKRTMSDFELEVENSLEKKTDVKKQKMKKQATRGSDNCDKKETPKINKLTKNKLWDPLSVSKELIWDESNNLALPLDLQQSIETKSTMDTSKIEVQKDASKSPETSASTNLTEGLKSPGPPVEVKIIENEDVTTKSKKNGADVFQPRKMRINRKLIPPDLPPNSRGAIERRKRREQEKKSNI